MFQLDNIKKYKMEADFSSSFYDTRGQGEKKEDTEQYFQYIQLRTSYWRIKW